VIHVADGGHCIVFGSMCEVPGKLGLLLYPNDVSSLIARRKYEMDIGRCV
jgi:hypothetical protein